MLLFKMRYTFKMKMQHFIYWNNLRISALCFKRKIFNIFWYHVNEKRTGCHIDTNVFATSLQYIESVSSRGSLLFMQVTAFMEFFLWTCISQQSWHKGSFAKLFQSLAVYVTSLKIAWISYKGDKFIVCTVKSYDVAIYCWPNLVFFLSLISMVLEMSVGSVGLTEYVWQ